MNAVDRGRANGRGVVNRKIKLVSILVNNVGVSRSHLPRSRHRECGGFVGKVKFTSDLRIRAQNGPICIRGRSWKAVVGSRGEVVVCSLNKAWAEPGDLRMSVINVKSMWPNVSGRPPFPHRTPEHTYERLILLLPTFNL